MYKKMMSPEERLGAHSGRVMVVVEGIYNFLSRRLTRLDWCSRKITWDPWIGGMRGTAGARTLAGRHWAQWRGWREGTEGWLATNWRQFGRRSLFLRGEGGVRDNAEDPVLTDWPQEEEKSKKRFVLQKQGDGEFRFRLGVWSTCETSQNIGHTSFQPLLKPFSRELLLSSEKFLKSIRHSYRSV